MQFIFLFINTIWVAAISWIFFLSGRFSWTILLKERYGESLSRGHPTFQLRGRNHRRLSFCNATNSCVNIITDVKQCCIAKCTSILTFFVDLTSQLRSVLVSTLTSCQSGRGFQKFIEFW